jgi:hypothetical protein
MRGRVCNLLVQLLLGLAKAVTLWSNSRRTYGHIVLSSKTPPTWRARSPYLYPPRNRVAQLYPRALDSLFDNNVGRNSICKATVSIPGFRGNQSKQQRQQRKCIHPYRSYEKRHLLKCQCRDHINRACLLNRNVISESVRFHFCVLYCQFSVSVDNHLAVRPLCDTGKLYGRIAPERKRRC